MSVFAVSGDMGAIPHTMWLGTLVTNGAFVLSCFRFRVHGLGAFLRK